MTKATSRMQILKGKRLISGAQVLRLIWLFHLVIAMVGIVYLCVAGPLAASYERHIHIKMAHDAANGHPWEDHTSEVGMLIDLTTASLLVWFPAMYFIVLGRGKLASSLANDGDPRTIPLAIDSLQFCSGRRFTDVTESLSLRLRDLGSDASRHLPDKQRSQLRGVLSKYCRSDAGIGITNDFVISIITALAAAGDTRSINIIRQVSESGKSDEVRLCAVSALVRLETRGGGEQELLRGSASPVTSSELLRGNVEPGSNDQQLLRSDDNRLKRYCEYQSR